MNFPAQFRHLLLLEDRLCPDNGAAAFLLAENLSMPYSKVALKSSIVAILYYFSFAMVHFKCLRDGISSETKGTCLVYDIAKQSYLAVPIIIL